MKIKSNKQKEEIKNFLKELRKKQTEIEFSDEVYYTNISLYYALKNNLLYSKILTHPCILVKDKIYKDRFVAETHEDAKEIFKQVIEYELTNEKSFFEKEERDSIIKFYREI